MEPADFHGIVLTPFHVLQTVNFQSLEILQEHGIAANDIQKLQNAGYHTVESVRTSCAR